ncbi:MAG TPA: lipopolysaccharide kinase InaA family protein [Pirellulales bacterium]|jgi:tRNA A-37 threonylcarbamoyl transferase component Bud32
MEGSQLAEKALLSDPPPPALAGGTADGVRWSVTPEWRKTLIGAQGLRLDEWLAEGRMHVVKHASHRTVYRVDLPHRSFFLKHYRVLAFLNALTHLLRGSAARREWRNALEVRRRHVPTVTPIALGEHYRGGLVRDSYFVSEAIADSCTLERYADECLPKLSSQEQARLRPRIILALAKLCAAAHRAGVYHTDFHRGNVLVGLDTLASPDVLPELHLIDLPKMWFSPPLSWAHSRDSLAMFAAAWLDRSSRCERWRFWKAYLAGRPELVLADPLAAGNEIVRRSRAHARKIFSERDKRCLRSNRDYTRVKAASAMGYAVRDLARGDLLTLMSQPDAPFAAPDAQMIKVCSGSQVVKTTMLLEGRPTPAAYKRSCNRLWRKAILALFRRSRALRAWHLGHALRERGIDTARPLLVVEPRTGGPRWESYLATEWVEGDHLHDYAAWVAAQPSTERRRETRHTAVVLGRMLGRMHAWNVDHRDLKAQNLMLARQGEKLTANLIDLDGVRFVRSLTERRRARNLARLATSMEAHPWLTRTDRLRFLCAYLAVAPLEKHTWKWFWRRVGRRSRVLTNLMRAGGREVL